MITLAELMSAARGYDINAPYDDTVPIDFIDNAQQEQTKEKEQQSTGKESSKPPPRLFTQIGVLVKNRVCVSWLVRDYLPLNSTCMTYGESGAGKTFAVLDMALHIACGLQWQGHKTKKGAVFYVAGEGQTGITARCYAWALHHGVDLENVPFYCTDGAVIPTDTGHNTTTGFIKGQIDWFFEDVDAWINSTGVKPSLIIFDTLARCFDGNENSSQDAGAYIKAIDRIKNMYGCCVMSIHHTGKDKSNGARGSSAFKGAWDAEHCLSVDSGIIELSTPKLKERQPLPPKAFRLESVNTDWLDDDGEIITSAVMVASDCAPSKSKGKPLDIVSKNVLTALHEAINKNGVDPSIEIKARFSDSPQNCPKKVVHIDDLRPLAYPYLNVAENSKRTTLKRCIEKLESKGNAMFFNDYLWLSEYRNSAT